MASGRLLIPLLSATTLALLAAFYASGVQSPNRLSPQGCRMSWMSPSYILQPDFNATWTRLSRRYSLWLYREVGWESHEEVSPHPTLNT
jgi:glycosylphosphatidylinositol deacylase